MDPLLAEIEPAVAEGDEEQSGAYYRCRDDIEHFRVKVRVSLVFKIFCYGFKKYLVHSIQGFQGYN